MEMFMSMFKGGIMGVLTVLVGWAKKQEKKEFDYRGLAIKLPMGLIVGIIAGYQGISFDQAHQFAASIGLIMMTDYIVKIILTKVSYFEKDKKLKKIKDFILMEDSNEK